MHGMAKLNDILCMQRKLCSVKCIVTKKKNWCVHLPYSADRGRELNWRLRGL